MSICQNCFVVVVLWVEYRFVAMVTIHSEQDLNKLVSPFTYVNKFPNTFKELQNKKIDLSWSLTCVIFCTLCVFFLRQSLMLWNLGLCHMNLSKFQLFRPVNYIKYVCNKLLKQVQHIYLTPCNSIKIKELRNKHSVCSAAVKLLQPVPAKHLRCASQNLFTLPFNILFPNLLVFLRCS